MKNLMKKVFALSVGVMVVLLIVGCIEVSDINNIEFVTMPKTTYLINEEIEPFTIRVEIEGEDDIELSSDDDRVSITGFNTSTTGTRTMTITVDELDGASINFAYNVVNSMTDTLFAGGEGTSQSPYLIETAQQLSNIRLALDKYYELVNDIDMSSIDWVPIGTINITYLSPASVIINVLDAFSGELDGKGFELQNLYSRSDSSFSLFMAIEGTSDNNAVVKNLSFTDVDIEAGGGACALGYTINYALIEDIEVSGEIKGTSAAGLSFIVIYRRVTNNADITGLRTTVRNDGSDYSFLGGITMTSQPWGDYTVTFEEAVNTGDITHVYAPGIATYAGQIIGQAQNNAPSGDASTSAIIINSSGTGTIIGNETGSYYGYTYVSETELSDEPDYVGTLYSKLVGNQHMNTPFTVTPEEE
jgi:hypothetical protein